MISTRPEGESFLGTAWSPIGNTSGLPARGSPVLTGTTPDSKMHQGPFKVETWRANMAGSQFLSMNAIDPDPDAKSSTASPLPAPVDDPRVYLAAERTFLAWIRTSVALMAFGFVIARFALFLREYRTIMAKPGPPQSSVSSWLGVGMIGVGVGVCLLASIRHRVYVHALKAGVANPPLPTTLALATAAVLAAAGVAIIVHIFLTL